MQQARPPPPHRALFIDEILAVVLVVIRDDRDWRTFTPRKTLARLARTCRAFTHSALDILWARQVSLMPLLQVLPTFRPHSGRFSYSNPITDSHWTRFQQYAARIHTLEYRMHSNLNRSVYDVLRQMTGNAPLFPSLRRLVWKQAAGDDPAPSMLKSSSLRDVNIALYELDWGVFDDVEGSDSNQRHAVELFLNGVLTKSSSLQRLVLAGPFVDSWMSSIQNLRELRRLDLSTAGPISLGLFTALSSMETLSDLSLHARDLTVGSSFARPAFRALETCTLSGSPSSICAILDTVDSTLLHSVTIVSGVNFTPIDLLSCARIIQTKFASVLRRVHMRLDIRFEAKEGVDITSMLEPLLGLALLEELHLEFYERHGHVRVRDVDIESMAAAWPQLRRIHLWHSGGDDPSVQALVSLAAHCPHLREVALVLSSVDAHDLPHAPATPHQLHSLRLLGNVVVPRDPERVVPCICALFPELVRFEAFAWEALANRKWAGIRRSILTANGTLKQTVKWPSRGTPLR